MASTIINTLKGAALLLLMNLCACTDYNYIDGGTANGIHDCTMWEYFESQTFDWDSTRIMIEQAGLKSYFDGSRQNEQITFFGVTDLVIARYMLKHNQQLDEQKSKGEPVDENDYWHRVKDIPASTCKSILEKMIVPQRFMLKDVPVGTRLKTGDGALYIEDGGKVYPALEGKLFVWMVAGDYEGVQDAGEKRLYIARQRNESDNWRIASTDIQTNTGVVHSMGYEFNIDTF